MDSATMVLAPRSTLPSRELAPSLLNRWPPEILSPILGSCLRRPVRVGQVHDRAVGLGLLRQPAADQKAELTARAASRLCLVGYGVPAQVEAASLTRLSGHLLEERRPFVVLGEADTLGVFEVHAVRQEPFDSWVLLGDLDFPGGQQMSLERFCEAWSAAGNGLVVAAADWDELPTAGPSFFGGLRDRDGSYHWITAGCDTDRHGRVLRFSV